MLVTNMKIVWLCIVLSITPFSDALSCVDENNKDLDWFVALKYPDGYDFVYYDSSHSKNDWTTPKYNLSHPGNIIAKTIEQSYSDSSDKFSAYYNDESADGVGNSYRGHLKGVLNFNKNSGYWLIHSVPKFPTPNKYVYDKGQTIYGQSFICISVSIKDLSSIAEQLLMMQSSVYHYRLSDSFSQDKTLMALLQKFVRNKRKASPTQKSILFSGKSIFQHHGKSRVFNKDLYADLVAPALESPLYAETWIRGDRVITPCKNKYPVYNVEEVKLDNKNYYETQDHSKWVFAEEKQIVCVGDINRMTSQFKRGGGTLCIKHPTLWQLFKKALHKFKPCQRINRYDQLLQLIDQYNRRQYSGRL